MFRRDKRLRVSILNKDWQVIAENIPITELPRKDELIWLESESKYFMVAQVIHSYLENGKDSIVLIVELLLKTPENEDK